MLFIETEQEYLAAADQFDEYQLIERPTPDQARQCAMLVIFMNRFIMAQPTEQETMH